ncbi:HutD/Ves family protein [Trinickia acidisoli]|uniref:HutD/Ves family protein n=1 Tax=Trinickia acidisoli TaxID=2767482 RepID=UPI001A9030B4|nr:HutD family protein [Trinickia acidisoli]
MSKQSHAVEPVTSPEPRIVRASALKAAPWKNGGGVTREIAAYPVGASLETFVWRVSVADVEQAGPFSRFLGIDRTLVLLAGVGMDLIEAAGAVHALREPLSIARFDGEAALEARLVGGATRDFNLMVRRDRASAVLEVWRGAGRHTLDADAALVFCARGSLDLRFASTAQSLGRVVGVASAPHGPATLSAMDTLVLDAPRQLACDVTGDGAALAVLIRYV